MNNDYDPTVLYVGRFQPPHKGHMTIFNESLLEGKKICIAVRNLPPSEENPLKAERVMELWEKIYSGNPLVMVILIPNITAIKYGRKVGYTLEEVKVEGKIASISATGIRESIRNGDETWKNAVDPSIHSDLEDALLQPAEK